MTQEKLDIDSNSTQIGDSVEQLETPKKKGIHPWIWGGILFWGAVFGMNAHFLTKAFTGMPEMVVDNYYEKGLVHDQTASERLAWEESGLTIEVIKGDKNWTVVLNQKVDQISGQLYRASNKQADIEANPVMGTSEIEFFRPTLKGMWELNLRVNHQGKWMSYSQRETN